MIIYFSISVEELLLILFKYLLVPVVRVVIDGLLPRSHPRCATLAPMLRHSVLLGILWLLILWAPDLAPWMIILLHLLWSFSALALGSVWPAIWVLVRIPVLRGL